MEEVSFLTQAIGYLSAAPDWVEAILAVLGAATAITVLTPSKVDDNFLGKATGILNTALGVLNTLAGNFGKNKNADAE